MTDASAGSGTTTPCPECGTTIEVDTRAIRWCLECEWNLDPGSDGSHRSRRAARRNEASAERLLARGARRWSGAGAIVAVVLGVAALLLTVACFAGGLALVVYGRHSPLLVGLGIILAVVAVALVPRPPLWATLDGQERVGLLAHELGHLAHGDPRRGRLVALGTQTLVRWWVALVPPPSTRRDGPARWAENVMMAVMRWLVGRWLAAIAWVQFPAVQRAELRSDRVAASVAGWAGYTRLLHHLRYGDRLGHAIALAVARRDGVDLHASVVDSLRSLPPREEERLRRLAAREPYDRQLTHPPVRIRLRAVDGLQDAGGVVAPDAGRWAAVDAELAPLMAVLAQRARDDHDARKDRYSGRRAPRAQSTPMPTARPG